MIRLWDSVSHELRAAWKGHDQAINSAASPDGKLLASASKDGTVRLWDLGTKKQVAELKHPGIVYDVAFHPDGTRLATAVIDHTIRLWDTRTWEDVAQLRGHQDYVHSVAFSPDGSRWSSRPAITPCASGTGCRSRNGPRTGSPRETSNTSSAVAPTA